MKRKVLVIGLRGQQITQIRQEFDKQCRLSFVESERTVNASNIGSASKCAEIVIVVTKFISHTSLYFVRDHKGYTPVYGAATKVAETLRNLLDKEALA